MSMAIKKLQNNFTTPEQSNRLLELGVPTDSADFFYCSLGKNTSNFGNPKYCYKPYSILSTIDYYGIYTIFPCWSVGRLIEIYHICDKPGFSFSFHVCFPNLISEMIYKIAEAKEHGWIDFSKLEE